MPTGYTTTVLIPTYNERENARHLIADIFIRHPTLRIIVIDDSSPDGTGDCVRALQKRYPNLFLLSRTTKEGLGAAYCDGIRMALHSGTDRIILMDADGSHAPEYIAPMLDASNTHDLVIGSRYVEGGGIEQWEWWRRALSYFGNLYARALTGLSVRDLTSGFQCYRRSLFARIDLEKVQASGYAFQIDIKFHAIRDAGASVMEIPIMFKKRRDGESKMSLQIIFEGIVTPLRLLCRRIGAWRMQREAR